MSSSEEHISSSLVRPSSSISIFTEIFGKKLINCGHTHLFTFLERNGNETKRPDKRCFLYCQFEIARPNRGRIRPHRTYTEGVDIDPIAPEWLNISSKTSVDWRSFCSEVCSNWFLNQEQIGGEGVEVGIDETQLVRRKYERGRLLKDIWLFGSIEKDY